MNETGITSAAEIPAGDRLEYTAEQRQPALRWQMWVVA
jgi:hypothetical protein